MNPLIVEWAGVPFSPFPVDSWQWLRGSVVYILCKKGFHSSTALYIGQTDTAQINPRHYKWEHAVALGMNQVHVHWLATTMSERAELASVLRDQIWTPLNDPPAARPPISPWNAVLTGSPSHSTAAPTAENSNSLSSPSSYAALDRVLREQREV